MVAIYQWKEPVAAIKNKAKLDPQRVGEIIAALPDDTDKPTALWQAAKTPRHYLHRSFNWNVQEAAEAHWRETAASIIRCIWRADYPEEGDNSPVLVNFAKDGEGKAYHRVEDVMTNRRWQQQVVADAKRDLMAWGERYKRLLKLSPNAQAAFRTLSDFVAQL